MVAPPERPAPYMITIDAGHEGQRIDNFLLLCLKGVPRSHVYRVLRRGEVRVNKGRIKPTYRLVVGDVVRIPPVQRDAVDTPPPPGAGLRQAISASVLHEDDGLLIINKPAGIAVHGGSGVSLGVIETLRALRPEAHFLELVHRLDRDTSGCLMIAKKRSVLRVLHTLLREAHGIDKRYLALLQGRWQGGQRVVHAALQKNHLQSGERLVRVNAEEGKDSASLFRPVHVYAQASLMDVSPLTGRTHQIRVHAAHIGQPVAGDEKYGDAAFNQQLRASGLKRLFLHAHRLSFTLPGAAKLEVEAPLDATLRAVLDRLPPIENAT